MTDRKCARCPEDDPRVVKQRHHKFGRANSPETIWLCLNCHQKITDGQNSLPRKVRTKSSSEADNRIMEDMTIGCDLELIGQRLKRRAVGKYGDSS